MWETLQSLGLPASERTVVIGQILFKTLFPRRACCGICDPSTQEAKTGGSLWVGGQPRQHIRLYLRRRGRRRRKDEYLISSLKSLKLFKSFPMGTKHLNVWWWFSFKSAQNPPKLTSVINGKNWRYSMQQLHFLFLIMLETESRAMCMVNKQVVSIYHRDTHQVLKMIVLETTQ